MTRLMTARVPALLLSLAVVAPVAACSGARSPDQTTGASSATTAPVSFVNKVWRGASSSGVGRGMLYVFLSDGTLVISSPHGTPAFGHWKQDGTGLTIVEEGRPNKADVLKLSADEFRIMINNPGNAVEIAFEPADQAPGSQPTPASR